MAAIKQRKGEKNKSVTSEDAKEDDKIYNADKQSTRKSGEVSFGTMLLFMTVFLGAIGCNLYYFYSKYGIHIFLGHGARDFTWTPYEWRNYIDENENTVLLIGGPHRSGTTILWEAIKSHPDVAGFGDPFETGVDYSEGILFQEVYPRFGVGLEFKKNFGAPNENEKNDGVGRYALLPGVHWTKENKKELLQDSSTLSRLLNRFAPFWDKNKKVGSDGLNKSKVWVEKSPQNGVLSTFLEGIYNMPVMEDGSVDLSSSAKPKRSATKFLYTTRHPIGNVYAIDKFVKESMGGFIDFEILLRNYIQLHKYMRIDEGNLESPIMWARLEDFTSNPPKVLKEVFGFLDVSNTDDVIDDILKEVGDVHSNPNGKYVKKWCAEGIKEHGHLLDKYGDDLKALDLGYDLDLC
ncbi:hypothetical protein TrCOL_g3179 [Triparma columacea]|uniref:Sulfotransferase n=1 Tax=Triparma columacea TaxID=722753 RepID=A0A9W7FWA9_9STRA|nr:hypothetical protein TrCOL_g3179 [Triparma columacea]